MADTPDDFGYVDPRSEGFPIASDTVPDIVDIINQQAPQVVGSDPSFDPTQSVLDYMSAHPDYQFNLSGNDTLDKIKKVADTLGLTNKDGTYDWKKIIGLGAAGITAFDTLNRKTVPVKTATELAGSLPSNAPPAFSQGALSAMQVPLKAGNQLQRQRAVDMPSALVPGIRTYAEGGGVAGPLSQGFVSGGAGGGQDDMVEARLSPGEYVFDAESVSMLGDGDNAAGARKLDELRAAMRAHKRSASPDEIAPRSLGPLSYMKGGLNG